MSFQLYADKNRLYRKDWETLTSGSVNVYAVRYQFSADWDGLTKTAVFKAEGTSVEVPLDEGNGCIIPWEVLTQHGIKLYAGVYGTHGADTVLPTMWVFLGEVLEGAGPSTGNTVNPPSGGGAGVPGPQGEKGEKGDPGEPGADGSNWQTYSTEEQAVGTWIDGRTIYRKTISFIVDSKYVNVNKYVDLDVEPIYGTLIRLYGSVSYIVPSGEGEQIPIPTHDFYNTYAVSSISNTSHKVTFFTNKTQLIGSKAHIVVEYVKNE